MSDDLRDAIATSMQKAWDAWVADTGCVPDSFDIKRGKVYANFALGNFPAHVAQNLAAMPALGYLFAAERARLQACYEAADRDAREWERIAVERTHERDELRVILNHDTKAMADNDIMRMASALALELPESVANDVRHRCQMASQQIELLGAQVLDDSRLIVSLEAERDRLARWKAEALTVLGEWAKVSAVVDHRAPLGGSVAAAVLERVTAITAELDEYHRRVRTLLDALDVDRATTIPKRHVRAILKGR